MSDELDHHAAYDDERHAEIGVWHEADQKKNRLRMIAYVAMVVIFAAGLYRVETRAETAKEAAAKTEKLAKANKVTLDAINADRAARVEARCETDHQNFLAAEQSYDAQKSTFDLIDKLLHQTSVDDPRLGLTPSQRQVFADTTAQAEVDLAEARGRVDMARNLVEQGDCKPQPVG